MQAEAWIKGKLQDLKDGCNIQRCPLQDWEEASQTLQRDLKDFENNLIQLNQVTKSFLSRHEDPNCQSRHMGAAHIQNQMFA